MQTSNFAAKRVAERRSAMDIAISNTIYRSMTIELPRPRTNLSASIAGGFSPPSNSLFDAQGGLEKRRRRIWEISGYLHCSIVGTCLTTAELRQILIKVELPGAHKETDHELHGRAVVLAGKRDLASKLLQKALDRRHRSTIAHFSKAGSAQEVRALWLHAVQRAEIPGAYWAVLTHPHSTEDLVRDVFGEVHMLSHLVGAANRADIRRLRDLEAENSALLEKVGRQQSQLRDAIVTRDKTITELNEMLGKAIAVSQHVPRANAEHADGIEQQPTAQLITELQRRLASEVDRRKKIERRLGAVSAERDSQRQQRLIVEERECELRQELALAELSLCAQMPASEEESAPSLDLSGMVLLYVGGRTHLIAQLRLLAERSGASFLHHDGGIEERSGLLEAQLSRADIVLFPVDCVSHNAVATVKRVSRYAGKPYLALRSSGLTSLVAGLRKISALRQAAREPPAQARVESRTGSSLDVSKFAAIGAR